MIRVHCPSCQKPHDFLEFYRGLTIFCKHCKAGILVPMDAESIPEGAAPLPVAAPPAVAAEPPRAPEPTRPDSSPPLAETNHRVEPAAAPPPEPMIEPPAVKPPRIARDDAPRTSKKRTLILAGILLIILAVGAALIARQMMQQNTPVVNVDPKKTDNLLPKPDAKPEPEKPDPKPIDEPKLEKEKIPLKATDFVVQSWYTSDHVMYFSPPGLKYYLDDDSLDEGDILLVVKARLSGTALKAKKAAGKWELDLNTGQFFIDDDGKKFYADGFEVKGGFMELVGKESRLVPKLTEGFDKEPSHFDIGLVFRVPQEDADDLSLLICYRDFPAVKLDGATRQKAPAAPAKKAEPEKKIETKTPPKKEEAPKKSEPVPKVEDKSKKTEPVKKSEEKPKKVRVEPPAEPQVEIVEWFVGDTLPSADPEKKRMPLSSSDRLDGNIFVEAQVKLMGKACVAKKGEVRWQVSLGAKDFSVQGDAVQPFVGRGLEFEGYGATNASGYIVWADRVIPFKEEPESLVIGVFFTIPRDVVERGDLELIFRDFPPVKLVESRRKKN
jgi:hypothetical protein